MSTKQVMTGTSLLLAVAGEVCLFLRFYDARAMEVLQGFERRIYQSLEK